MILRELAQRLGCTLRGDGAVEVHRVAGIEDSGPGDLTFVANRKYAACLATTRASAVILAPTVETPLPSLLSPNPYLAYARAATLLHPQPRPRAGVHPSAQVDPSARLGPDVHVGALAVVGARRRARRAHGDPSRTSSSTTTSRSARTACCTPACRCASAAGSATAWWSRTAP